ncbi:MAG: hypothetical protein BGO10_01915 [Chlamydia sp. 32-24]|nr:MAG: hypothetical protein BGO10_01915 [Chlamydia sp. 32-24]
MTFPIKTSLSNPLFFEYIPTHSNVDSKVEQVKKGNTLVEKIEQSFLKNEPFVTTIEAIIFSHFSSDTLPNDGQKELCRKWIRNATYHIFSDPLRSFLELVTNAIDASYPKEESIGKYGMGFFSILSFLTLKETNGCKLSLTTTYKENEVLKTYKIIIENSSDKVDVSYFKLEDSLTKETGTQILIQPNDEPFSEELLISLKNYVYYLQFIEKTFSLEYQPNCFSDKKIQTIGNSFNPSSIFVNLNPYSLEVKDNGIGIPLKVSVEKLFIPSGSSKIQESARTHHISLNKCLSFVSFKGKSEIDLPYFIITVNNVLVFKLPLKKTFFIPAHLKNGDDLCLQLSSATQLTLSRDEILINKKTSTEKEIKQIIDLIFKEMSKSDDPSIPYLFVAFYNSLEAWEAMSNSNISGLFTTYCKNQLNKLLLDHPTIFPVDQYVATKIQTIIDKTSGLNEKTILLPLPSSLVNYNFNPLTHFLYNHFSKVLKNNDLNFKELQILGLDGQIIDQTMVCFVPNDALPHTPEGTPIISKFGLLNTLFCPFALLEEISATLPIKEQALLLGSKILFSYFDKGGVTLAKNLIGHETSHSISHHSVFINSSKQFTIKDLENRPWDNKGEYLLKIYENYNVLTCNDKSIDLFWNKIKNRTFLNEVFNLTDLQSKESLLKAAVEIFEDYHSSCQQGYDKLEHIRFFPYAGSLFFLEEKGLILEVTDRKKIFKTYQRFKRFRKKHKTMVVTELLQQFFSNSETLLSITTPICHKAFINYLFLTFFRKNKLYHPNSVESSLSHEDSSPFVMLGTKNLYPFSENSSVEQISQLFAVLFFITYKNNSIPYIIEDDVLEEFFKSEKQLIFKSKHIPKENVANINRQVPQLSFILRHVKNLQKIKNSDLIFDEIAAISKIFFLLEQNNSISVLQRALIESLRFSFWKLCDQALTIDLKIENARYASNAIQFKSTNISDINPIIDAFLVIQENTDELEKIIQFSISHWTKAIGLKDKDDPDFQKLAENSLKIPTLDFFSPIYILKEIISQEIDINLLKITLRLSRCVEEFCLISYLLLTTNRNDVHLLKEECYDFHDYLFKGKEKKKNLNFALETFIKQFLHEKISLYVIKYWYNSHLNKNYFDYSLFSKEQVYQDFCSYLRESDKQKKTTSISQLIPNQLLEKLNDYSPPFTVKQLINAFFENNNLKIQFQTVCLDDILKTISKANPNLEINCISQSINNGTERDPNLAIAIETIQNAMDATHNFLQKDQLHLTKKSCDLRKGIYQNVQLSLATYAKRHLCYTIHDTVGFYDLSVLLQLLIPNYSEKKDCVGQLGNGFFSLFQNAFQVIIETRLVSDPHKFYLINLIPLYQPSSTLIEDIKCQIIDSSDYMLRENSNFFGTKITIVKNGSENPEIDLVSFQHILKETIGTTHVIVKDEGLLKIDLGHYCLNYNMQGKTFSSLLKDEVFGFEIITIDHDCNIPSHVTTGGIPFIPLFTLVEQYQLCPPNLFLKIAKGLILELPKGTFTPVQSRTKIELSHEQQDCLRKLLANAIFYCAFDEAFDHNKLDDCFLFYNSKATLDQIQLDINVDLYDDYVHSALKKKNFSLQEFMTYFEPFVFDHLSQKSFYELVEYFYTGNLSDLELENNRLLNDWLNEYNLAIKDISLTSSEEQKEKAIEQCLQIYKQWDESITAILNQLNRKLNEKLTVQIDPSKKDFWNKFIVAFCNYFKPKSFRVSCLYNSRESLLLFQPKLNKPKTLAEPRRRENSKSLHAPANSPNLDFKISPTIERIHAKDTTSLESLKSIKENKKLKKKEKRKELHQKIYQVIKEGIKQYYVYYLKGINVNLPPPNVSFIFEINHSDASYTAFYNQLNINFYNASYAKIVHLFSDIAHDKFSKISEGLNELFWPNALTSGSLNHEGEHLRNRHLSCKASHGTMITVDGKAAPFEASAIISAQRAIHNKMFFAWFAKIKEICQDAFGPDFPNFLKKAAEKYQSHESQKTWVGKLIQANEIKVESTKNFPLQPQLSSNTSSLQTLWWEKASKSVKSQLNVWSHLATAKGRVEEIEKIERLYKQSSFHKATYPFESSIKPRYNSLMGTVYAIPGEFSLWMPGVAMVASYLKEKKQIEGLFVCKTLEALAENLASSLESPNDQRSAFIVGSFSSMNNPPFKPNFPQHKSSVCFEIKDGKATVILLDAQPLKNNKYITKSHLSKDIWENYNGLHEFTPQEVVMRAILKGIHEAKIPITLFYSQVKREVAYGCEVYALQDAIAFLKDPGFFQKITTNGRKISIRDNLILESVNYLPPEFMIGTQSINKLKKYVATNSNIENEQLISKKGEKTLATYIKSYAFSEENKEQNHYITKKSYQYLKFVAEALTYLSVEDVQAIVKKSLLT